MTKESLQEIIDAHGMSRYQIVVIGLCGLIALLDGFDTQAIAFIVPILAKEWELPLSAFGPIFAIGLLGGLLGAVAFGMIADRYGRRITLLTTVAIFGIGSLLTLLSDTHTELAAYRLITGFGLGGALPSIIALTSEYAPERLRSTLVTAMFCGFPLGAVLGAIGSAPLIEWYGWHTVFWVGGLAPLMLLPALVIKMPESISWLSKQGATQPIKKILDRLDRSDLWNERLERDSGPATRVSLLEVFHDGRVLGTFALGCAFFISLLLVYLLVSWVPTIAVQAGHSVRASIMTAAILNLTGIMGSLAISRISDRYNGNWVVGMAYITGAVGTAVLAFSGGIGPTIFIFSVIVGLFCIGAQVCMIALASAFYPVHVRARGLGVLVAAGRIGAISGPMVGALFIDGSSVGSTLAYIVVFASVIAAIAIVVAGWSKNRDR